MPYEAEFKAGATAKIVNTASQGMYDWPYKIGDEVHLQRFDANDNTWSTRRLGGKPQDFYWVRQTDLGPLPSEEELDKQAAALFGLKPPKRVHECPHCRCES